MHNQRITRPRRALTRWGMRVVTTDTTTKPRGAAR